MSYAGIDHANHSLHQPQRGIMVASMRWPSQSKGEASDRASCDEAYRSLRASRNLCPAFGYGPLRSPLHILHVGEDDLSAKTTASDTRGDRPPRPMLQRAGRHKTSDNRRRTAGPAQCHLAVREIG